MEALGELDLIKLKSEQAMAAMYKKFKKMVIPRRRRKHLHVCHRWVCFLVFPCVSYAMFLG